MLLLISAPMLFAQTKLDKMRQKAWKEWVKTYNTQDELRLPTPEELSRKTSFFWDIPTELESNARMNFYSGTKGERPSEGYPLFLYLHGSGPSHDEWETGWKLAKDFKDAPSLYYVPRIPNEGELYRWWQKGKLWVWDRLLRHALIDGHTDPNRIYLFGISEGGYGSQRLASYYADYLAAAGPMAGGEPLINAPVENLSALPFSLLTGENDMMFYRNYLTQVTGYKLDSLATLYLGQYTHRVALQAGRGHGIDYSQTTPWMANFKRNATPSSFRWENYEIDGIKRNSFYNIEVLEEEQNELRNYYDYQLQDNRVTLSVSQVNYTPSLIEPNWGIALIHDRKLSPASHGKLRIYFNEKTIDATRPIEVVVNGKTVFKGLLKADKAAMQQSLSVWGDPLRIFPYAALVEF